MKITNLEMAKKAVDKFNRIRATNRQDNPRYAQLMYNTKTGELWCDEFLGITNVPIRYTSSSVVNIGKRMPMGNKITFEEVKKFIEG